MKTYAMLIRKTTFYDADDARSVRARHVRSSLPGKLRAVIDVGAFWVPTGNPRLSGIPCRDLISRSFYEHLRITFLLGSHWSHSWGSSDPMRDRAHGRDNHCPTADDCQQQKQPCA